MKKTGVLAGVLILFIGIVAKSTDETTPSESKVTQLMELQRLPEFVNERIEQLFTQLNKGAKGNPSILKLLNEEQKKKLFNDEMSEMKIFFAKTFTFDEIEQLIKLSRDPVMQKYIRSVRGHAAATIGHSPVFKFQAMIRKKNIEESKKAPDAKNGTPQ